ncbi:phytanoyl-CoA dioxygenase family protein [Thalassococcus sp. CAU 1522]|uniref:Phytanoyl-CoA dioxygenase family protein n=1 Tax=Thalassococcus arenae TaxID=2851652 RepID=A0ABS6N4E7_9RHOB|nr:phytanoyl-CoA dioxygenase family protein [Thalassococcus arenae]MBV2358464.1 phytanoyl-CoA dioxygenase family protein [Thalassococcus arenae]
MKDRQQTGLPAFFGDADCDLGEFKALVAQRLDPKDVSHAAEIVSDIPAYDVAGLGAALADPGARHALKSEWAWVLGQGPGVLLLRRAYADTAPIDAASAIYEAIIARERAESGGKGDHFAKAGANDRIWNALQKLCQADPAVFARYFGNDAIAAVCEAWLGPGYQMTAQVNLVRPGGAAQSAHRDYHLGFQSDAVARTFPAHAHLLSAALTLQGAVAHCDMPLDSGPTRLLPFSQAYPPGYLAYRRADFAAFFDAHCVQVPLAKGDALFFNPALFHAAGENRSADIQRMANLLQVSSAFGRAMESVDRVAMCKALFPVLAAGGLSGAERAAAIAACAEGYAFPTNLDNDPPLGGMAPQSQAALMVQALDEGWDDAALGAALDAQAARRLG